jgi:hypothetical protein
MNQGEVALDQFNASLRSSQFYQDWMRAHGIDITKPVGLTDSQRKAFRRDLEAIGVQFQGDLEIDKAGNMNQNEGFGKQLKRWGPIVGGAAALAFGIPAIVGAVGAPAGAGGFSFSSIAPTIIGAGGKFAGDFIAGRGASKAADAQERAAREALDWEKSRYFEQEQRLAPYRDMGGQAYERMGRMLGIQPGPASAPAPTNPVDRMSSMAPRPVGGGQTPAAASNVVTMMSPDGRSRRQVPAHLVAQFEARGARRIG